MIFTSSELCVHGVFEEQAARAPDQVAVVLNDQRMSYGELNQRANQLAHKLRGLGAVPDALVGLLAERSLEMVVGMVAILKAGAAYVPLDPSWPDQRLSFVLADIASPVILAQPHLFGRRPPVPPENAIGPIRCVQD